LAACFYEFFPVQVFTGVYLWQWSCGDKVGYLPKETFSSINGSGLRSYHSLFAYLFFHQWTSGSWASCLWKYADMAPGENDFSTAVVWRISNLCVYLTIYISILVAIGSSVLFPCIWECLVGLGENQAVFWIFLAVSNPYSLVTGSFQGMPSRSHLYPLFFQHLAFFTKTTMVGLNCSILQFHLVLFCFTPYFLRVVICRIVKLKEVANLIEKCSPQMLWMENSDFPNSRENDVPQLPGMWHHF